MMPLTRCLIISFFWIHGCLRVEPQNLSRPRKTCDEQSIFITNKVQPEIHSWFRTDTNREAVPPMCQQRSRWEKENRPSSAITATAFYREVEVASEALDEKNSTNLEYLTRFGLNRINRAYRSDRKLVAAGLENPRKGISILHWKGPNTGQSCIVTLLDYGRAIQAALAVGFEMLGIFGDARLLPARKQELGIMIKKSLKYIPPDADVLYIDGCHDGCSLRARMLSTDYPFGMQTTEMCSSAATIFTLKGARRLLRLMTPIFRGIDELLNAAIRAKLFEAHVIAPNPEGLLLGIRARWPRSKLRQDARRPDCFSSHTETIFCPVQR
jgi:hypothetical protein